MGPSLPFGVSIAARFPLFGVSNTARLTFSIFRTLVTAQDPGRLALVSPRTFHPHSSSMTSYHYG